MKKPLLFLLALLLSGSLHAQKLMKMRNLWDRPQVHIIFNGYLVSFTIHDINKTLRILREMGDSSVGPDCGLDTSKDYTYELYPGFHTEFHYPVQPLIQNVVGAYLLSIGHALVIDARKKVMPEIIVDVEPMDPGEEIMHVTFYDPKKKINMLFEGKMAPGLLNRDIGIDD